MSSKLTPDQIKAARARAAKEGWAHSSLVAFDQMLNAFAFRWLRGYAPDQTMSSHFQIAADQGSRVGKGMTKFLWLFQKQHGERAAAGDLERAEEVEQAEEKDLGVKDE